MTEQTTAPETTTTAIDPTVETPPGTPTTPETAAETAAGSTTEAKRYRQRAQAAESERDTLREQLTQLQRGQVEALASDLAQPADVLDTALGGVGLDDLIDAETGAIDAEAVHTAVAAVIEARPALASATHRPTPPTGTYAQAGQFSPGVAHGRQPASWSKVIGR